MLGLGFYTCREALRRLDDYVDRELTPRETELVERHLRLCTHCARKFATEKGFISGVRDKLMHIAVPPRLRSRIEAALHEAASEERPHGAAPQ